MLNEIDPICDQCAFEYRKLIEKVYGNETTIEQYQMVFEMALAYHRQKHRNQPDDLTTMTLAIEFALWFIDQ